MKTTRPCTGILLLAAAISVVFAPQCGLVGHTVARALQYLIGSTGTVLLTITLVLLALACLIPRGTAKRVWAAYRQYRRQRPRAIATAQLVPARAPSRSQELRQAMLDQGYDLATVEQALPQMVALSEGIEAQIRASARPPAKVVPLRPVHDDVRTGLKGLGFERAEIDAVLPQLDRTKNVQDQLRAALKILKRAA